jgi:hypothetical protein
VTFAMTETETLEACSGLDGGGVLGEARAEALTVLAQLKKRGMLDSRASDIRSRPEFWVGRLEGVIMSLVAAADVELGGVEWTAG